MSLYIVSVDKRNVKLFKKILVLATYICLSDCNLNFFVQTLFAFMARNI